ncbi:LLM class flavin-dependent oxidoreductase [Luteipulveratus sp. YIM 133132]|uniref:LLM class flavin-dependent oxidoreductase n=1 Tax=Luteipulveratus flavus TaxID=3031728 RepID=UPI0023B1A51E|nr:LLM class flavin-dependent oxidoreductase [Luteipulveratus sp. YIM 133132]MDE9366637.1 LLM class flavin-dependent oxidoreductase [Luteipulveratus sp. YIM 133132]
MRFGITILPEYPWAQAAPLWRRAEELGFDHAWTYDHLVWGGLPDSPWFGTTPTLTAAATVTSRIRLGTFVTSPNYRHPVTFMRDLLALDDISGGRFVCGIGAGGDVDARLLGGPDLTPRQRYERFEEFTELLDRLLREDHVSSEGHYFSARDARTLPGPVRTRIPFVMAANGPRALRLAARIGQGWVTYGKPGDSYDAWWASLRDLSRRLDDALEQERGSVETFERHLNLDPQGFYSLESVGRFEDAVGRAAEIGFTDLITHWPRPTDPYRGSLDVLEQVAAEVMPRWP